MADEEDNNENTKRPFDEMDKINDDPLLPFAKRQKLDEEDEDQEITKEDVDFLFQLKQQNEASLHGVIGNGTNHSVNVTTDINHTSYFAAPSIASTNNSTTMDALSTTATIHTNPPNIDCLDASHENKVAEKYYRHIVHRSSRVGKTYQATCIPLCTSQSQQGDDAKYGGIVSNVESPITMAEKLRNERNEKRNNLDKNTTSNEQKEEQSITNMMMLNEINLEEDDDEEDEDFNMDGYDNNEDNNEDNNVLRVMEGIMGRKCDWLPGDSGKPFDDNTRIQYLVKWKDSAQPVWEYADGLEQYAIIIDQFEDDEMEDELCEINEDAINMNQLNENEEEKEAPVNTVDDLQSNQNKECEKTSIC